jgi:serine/threonine protein kinase
VLDTLTNGNSLSELRPAIERAKQFTGSLGLPIREGDLGSLGDLAIEAVIGTGGMGIVYRGRDERLGRKVAVKVIKHEESRQVRARFDRETKALAKLNHDHVVPLYSAGWSKDGRPFLVMPLVEGISLKERIAQGDLEIRQGAEFVRQIATGLSAAHAMGLIHRDVKPANILLDVADNRAKLTDFGLSRSIEDRTLTQADMLCGTPEYMSPEQADHPDRLNERSDIYSLGITLYECLTGATPYRGRPLEVLDQHRAGYLTVPTKLNRAIPRDLETICLKAMANEPEQRYATAQTMAEDLSRFLEGRPILARPVSRFTHVRLWCRRNRSLAAMIGLFALSLVAGTTIIAAMWLRSERNAAAASQLADDLQANRDRLKDSVRRFQSRIFSVESLHWEMSNQFRASMFRDVIEYLDEFSRYENADATDGSTEGDVLAQDYLKVAEAAFQVGQLEEATLAANRAWTRLQDEMEKATHPVLEDWVTRNKTARLMLEISKNRKSGFDKQQITDWVADAVRSANRVLELRPDDPTSQLIKIQTSFQQTMNNVDCSREKVKAELEKLFQSLNNFRKEIAEGLEPAEFALLFSAIGWELARLSEGDESNRWFDEVMKGMHWCREGFRRKRLPMLMTDRLIAINEVRRAIRSRERGDRQAASAALTIADRHFHEAVDLYPQNRIWRRELAEFQSLYGEYLIGDGEASEEGVKRLGAVLTQYVKLLETDPADHELRMRAIEHFNRFGEVAQSQGDFFLAWKAYYTAAQDCLLLGECADEIISWSIQMRIWAYQRALEAAEQARLTDQRAEMEKNVWLWLQRLEKSHPLHYEFAQKLLASETPVTLPEPLFKTNSVAW